MVEDLPKRPLADSAMTGAQMLDVRHDLVESRKAENTSSDHKAISVCLSSCTVRRFSEGRGDVAFNLVAASDELLHDGRLNRLDEMAVEPSFGCPDTISFPAVAGEGHDERVFKTRLSSQPPGHFVAVHARKPDVKENHFGVVHPGNFQGHRAVVGQINDVAAGLQHLSQNPGAVDIVVDQKHAARAGRGIAGRRRG